MPMTAQSLYGKQAGNRRWVLSWV